MPETAQYELTASRVDELIRDCLYSNSELPDPPSDEPPEEAVRVEGVVNNFAFHPERLAGHKQEIIQMLDRLPDEFSVGSGWSFLNACMRKDGSLWGEHRNIEALLVLGIGVGRVRYCAPREYWEMLPGGMPYFVALPKDQARWAVNSDPVEG
jgi:hypothetical protein